MSDHSRLIKTLMSASQDVTEICQPLFQETNIDYFNYIKTFSDGSMLHLSNNGKWLEYYVDKKLYQISNFRAPPQHYSANYILCSNMQGPAQQIATEASQFFCINNVITFVNKHEKECEFIQFGTSKQDNTIINFYLSHIDLLRLFTFYFKDVGNKIICKLIKNKNIIPRENNDTIEVINNFDGLKCKIDQRTKRYYFDVKDNDLYLTRREIECLRLVILGQSPKEIAKLLNLSSRTVEKHIENVKLKLDCSKLSQLTWRANLLGIPC